ncbi:MAG: hypothetical protein IKF19_05025 [Bacilli bacterium]|nr:hypothetical protein [Bacilli bacterium]
MLNDIFIEEFNQLFNKIPHIYGEIFLIIFRNNYCYFLDYDLKNNLTIFVSILKKVFYNLNELSNKEFYYHDILDYFSGDEEDINKLSVELSKSIEEDYLLEIIDNKANIKNISNISDSLFKIYVYYLISKALVKIVKVLSYYNSIINTAFKNDICCLVEKYRTLELNMDYVLEDYNYDSIISKTDYKILIYLLSLSSNGKEIEKKYYKDISSIMDSVGYDTNMHRIINYQRLNINIKPYIYQNITNIFNTLFYKYYDNYNLISDKDIILRTIYYIYIKNISLFDKIIISITYNLWNYEWDSIKDIYLYKYL